MRRRSISALLLGVLLIPMDGCGPPTILTNARFEIDLPTHYNEQALVAAFDSPLVRAGYVRKDQPTLWSELHGYNWHVLENGRRGHQVDLLYPGPAAKNHNIEFVFYKDVATPFDERDWRMFFYLRDVIVPSVLPTITRRTTRHPAEFTEDKDLEALSKVSPEPLPAADLRRLREFKLKHQR